MQFLLDTHTFIWFINGDSSLPYKIIDEIKNLKNQCFISIASIWEIAIKCKLHKLSLNADFNRILDFLDQNQIEILPISFDHIVKLNELDFHHRDPFDRILIAQGISENLIILTKDQNFSFYKIKTLW
ncbi:PIN domain nuclease, a component of toxin-antitoxin system (PIN domain) [Pedobacter terrae]|uniref:PIN domain nuclease, a component of toxin-antitoxin system (PIN domain) n=1 Tax=Pedobacter terrae TaxID=405671 RepID=A0A1G7S7P4_9SPHI|nr:type II toxin-antitoxin system VapC family toxin [Pedobacter terrae]SDG19065.1 PIN domain nuclease, a component of toxin-antitoxin system (PIN domain) [Pedobacter terrae]